MVIGLNERSRRIDVSFDNFGHQNLPNMAKMSKKMSKMSKKYTLAGGIYYSKIDGRASATVNQNNTHVGKLTFARDI